MTDGAAWALARSLTYRASLSKNKALQETGMDIASSLVPVDQNGSGTLLEKGKMKTIRKQFLKVIVAISGILVSQLTLAGVTPNGCDIETGCNSPVSVPEPETLALFALGVTAIAIARRLRK